MKKLLLLMLATALLIFTPAAQAAESKPNEDAVRLLSGLGITYTDGTINYKSFYKDALSLTGAKVTENDAEQLARHYFNATVFDGTITLKEAVKTVMTVLGYTDEALAGRDFKSVAQDLKLYKNIGIKDNDRLTSEAEQTLFYNALFAYPAKLSEVNSDGKVTYDVSKKENYLKYAFDTEKIEGVITANRFGSIDKADGCGKGEIEIDGTPYKISDKYNDPQYIGRRVKAYICDDKNIDADVVVYLFTTDDDDIITIAADDVDNRESKSTLIKYYVNDRKKTVSLDKFADIMYNYKMLGEVNDRIFNISGGKIILTDRDGNGTYDFAHILEYEDYVVASYSKSSKMLVGKYGNSVKIDTEEDNVKFYVNGDEASPEVLTEWNAVSVFKSKYGNTLLAYYSPVIAAGAVKYFDIDDKEINILDNKYNLDSTFVKAYNEGNSNTDEIKKGDMVIVYLDYMGNVAAIQKSDSDTLQYGYLTKLTKDENGVETKVIAKMIDTTGKEVRHYLTNKVKFNGVSEKAENIAVDSRFYDTYKDENNNDFTGFKAQLVKYKLDAENKIRELEVAAEGTYKDVGQKEFTMNYASESMRFRESRYLIREGGTDHNRIMFYVPAKTVVFKVPKPSGKDLEEDNCTVEQGQSYSETERRDAEVYDVSEQNIAGAVVLYSESASSDNNGHDLVWQYNSVIMVVGAIKPVLDKDGVERKAVVDLKSGKEYVVGEDYSDYISAANVQKGDIIVIRLQNGEIAGVRKSYSHNSTAAEDISLGVAHTENIAYEKEENYGIYNVRSDSERENFSNSVAPYAQFSTCYGPISADVVSDVFSVDIGNYNIPIHIRNANNIYRVKYSGTNVSISKASASDLVKGTIILGCADLYRYEPIFILEYDN